MAGTLIDCKSEGEGDFGDRPDSAEFQARHSRHRALFDIHAGVPHEVSLDPERSHLVVGLYGLMPYVVEINAAAYLTDKGDLTGRLEGEYDLQIHQRLILQPRVELNVAAKELAELRIGSGVGSIEASARLRKEGWPEFAPYIGFGWERKLGDKGDLARARMRTAGGRRPPWELGYGFDGGDSSGARG